MVLHQNVHSKIDTSVSSSVSIQSCELNYENFEYHIKRTNKAPSPFPGVQENTIVVNWHEVLTAKMKVAESSYFINDSKYSNVNQAQSCDLVFRCLMFGNQSYETVLKDNYTKLF